MKLKKASKTSVQIPYNDIIQFKKNDEFPNIYDVELQHPEYLGQFDSVECHIVLYPYSRNICSGNIKFYPYEEYVKDILSQQKSAYTQLNSQFDKMFGIFLGLLITFIFFIFKPVDLFSVESIVSVLGAYFFGKELWVEIERILIDVSKTWRIRYLENYYAYQLGKHTTLTHYSYFAKKHRYGKAPLLPEKIDFIEQSNSQTVRMYFNMKARRAFQNASSHILSIHLDPELVQDFEDKGFLFGVKLSFNKSFLGFTKSLEFFQSLHKYAKGCLDHAGEWIEDGIFYRKTLTWGRMKLFLKHGVVKNQSLLKPKRSA
jgi:hypothetical protein